MSEGVEMICVGLSRTGTSSLKAALSILLPGITYHGMDFLNEINNPESYEFWLAMSEGRATTKMIRDYFISRQCSAVCDVPSILYWREIHAAFPSAKLVLTVRDPGKWFTSINNTLVPLAIMVDRQDYKMFLVEITLFILYFWCQMVLDVENHLLCLLRQNLPDIPAETAPGSVQQEGTAG